MRHWRAAALNARPLNASVRRLMRGAFTTPLVFMMVADCGSVDTVGVDVGICDVLSTPEKYLERKVVLTDAVAVGNDDSLRDHNWLWLAGRHCKRLGPIYVAIEPGSIAAKEKVDSIFFVGQSQSRRGYFQQECRLQGDLLRNTGAMSTLVRYSFSVNDLTCGPRVPDIEFIVQSTSSETK